MQQIASRASCSTNVISLSLVIISRSVGWEIQICLPEGCKRRILGQDTNFAHRTCGECTDCNSHVHAWWVIEAFKQEVMSSSLTGETVKSLQQQLLGHSELKSYRTQYGAHSAAEALPSCLTFEKHFHLSSCSYSFSVDVMVFKTSVLWCHQWLFIVYVLGNCDNA